MAVIIIIYIICRNIAITGCTFAGPYRKRADREPPGSVGTDGRTAPSAYR